MTRALPHLPSLPQGWELLDGLPNPPSPPPCSLLFRHAGLLTLTQLLSHVPAVTFRLFLQAVTSTVPSGPGCSSQRYPTTDSPQCLLLVLTFSASPTLATVGPAHSSFFLLWLLTFSFPRTENLLCLVLWKVGILALFTYIYPKHKSNSWPIMCTKKYCCINSVRDFQLKYLLRMYCIPSSVLYTLSHLNSHSLPQPASYRVRPVAHDGYY